MFAKQKWAIYPAMASCIFSVVYSVTQILSLLHLTDTPVSLASMFLPSLLLALCFPVVVVCLYSEVTREEKIYLLQAIVFAVMYSTVACLVYFVQLVLVIPNYEELQSMPRIFSFETPSVFIAADTLAYVL